MNTCVREGYLVDVLKFQQYCFNGTPIILSHSYPGIHSLITNVIGHQAVNTGIPSHLHSLLQNNLFELWPSCSFTAILMIFLHMR